MYWCTYQLQQNILWSCIFASCMPWCWSAHPHLKTLFYIVQVRLVFQIVSRKLCICHAYLNAMPILLSFNAIFGTNFCVILLLIPDYVLEGSKGTPFEGKVKIIHTRLHYLLISIFVLLPNLYQCFSCFNFPLQVDIIMGSSNFHQIILLNLRVSGVETFSAVNIWEMVAF